MVREQKRAFKLTFPDGRQETVYESFGTGSPEQIASKYGAQTAYRTDAQRGQGFGKQRRRGICID
jgi:hypothetical protein